MTHKMPFDPAGEDYALWSELNACTHCDGVGEDFIEDEFDRDTGLYGVQWVCRKCGGSGLDPGADLPAEIEEDGGDRRKDFDAMEGT